MIKPQLLGGRGLCGRSDGAACMIGRRIDARPEDHIRPRMSEPYTHKIGIVARRREAEALLEALRQLGFIWPAIASKLTAEHLQMGFDRDPCFRWRSLHPIAGSGFQPVGLVPAHPGDDGDRLTRRKGHERLGDARNPGQTGRVHRALISFPASFQLARFGPGGNADACDADQIVGIRDIAEPVPDSRVGGKRDRDRIAGTAQIAAGQIFQVRAPRNIARRRARRRRTQASRERK